MGRDRGRGEGGVLGVGHNLIRGARKSPGFWGPEVDRSGHHNQAKWTKVGITVDRSGLKWTEMERNGHGGTEMDRSG